jgi:hypothetical protein
MASATVAVLAPGSCTEPPGTDPTTAVQGSAG